MLASMTITGASYLPAPQSGLLRCRSLAQPAAPIAADAPRTSFAAVSRKPLSLGEESDSPSLSGKPPNAAARGAAASPHPHPRKESSAHLDDRTLGIMMSTRTFQRSFSPLVYRLFPFSNFHFRISVKSKLPGAALC